MNRRTKQPSVSVASDLQSALVVGAFGRHCLIETDEGQRLIAHPRGKKNQAVVGDRVLWQATGDEASIEQLQPRRNLFYRQDEIRTKSFAANLDRVLILLAAEPEFSESQLARALVACEAERIVPVIAPVAVGADGQPDLAPLVADLKADLRAAGLLGAEGSVWHCSVAIPATDPAITDSQWREVAEAIAEAVGLEDTRDGAVRWVAVRHGRSAAGNSAWKVAACGAATSGSAIGAKPAKGRSTGASLGSNSPSGGT